MGNNNMIRAIPIYSSAVVEHSDRQSEQIPCAATTTSLEWVGIFDFKGGRTMAYKLAYDLGWNAAANDQSARCPDGLDSDGWIDGYCDYIWSLIRKAMK